MLAGDRENMAVQATTALPAKSSHAPYAIPIEATTGSLRNEPITAEVGPRSGSNDSARALTVNPQANTQSLHNQGTCLGREHWWRGNFRFMRQCHDTKVDPELSLNA